MATFTLTGSGTQALSTPGSLAVTITVVTVVAEAGAATPSNWYHVGLLRLGTAHGYLPTIPIDATTQVIPCPVGCSTLGYFVKTGFTITVEERAEVLQYTTTLPSIFAVQQTLHIPTFSRFAIGDMLAGAGATQANSTTLGTANLAAAVPFTLLAPFTLTRFFIPVVTQSGHLDLGIYDAAFSRLASTGSTLIAGSGVQSIAASLTLQPGNYYMAVVVDNTTFRGAGLTAIAITLRAMGLFQMAAAFPLPTTFVPAAYASTIALTFGISGLAQAV